ncbi:hypothetical protein BVC80_1701g38 [Macleaya cordata]|uniref:Uncharacterized protein n=1 Tax=Macleaya cordata TaxID=56857 RepID=A0A200Q5Y4_MACCD|nr:hypothetical protein BVC80_1701g38 [Macleaya cordata]
MNGGLSSQCSSRCESGWTMYLNHSGSPNHCKRSSDFVDEGGFFGEEYKAKEEEVEEEEEEEDLSMVSDASSGPPHFHEDEDYCDENGCSCFSSSTAALAKKSGKRQKIKDQHQQKQEHHPSLLDDTASSPLFSFSKINNQQAAVMENVLDFSQGFSATHFKGRSTFQKHFGFLESSLPGTNFNKTSGLQQGRK